MEIPASLPAGETPASLPAWPGGAGVAVALTFDVDAEAPWLGEDPEYASRLTMLSQARYGPARGLGRILDLLAAAGLRATFYVPGHTADHYPAAVEAILDRGHGTCRDGHARSRPGLVRDARRDRRPGGRSRAQLGRQRGGSFGLEASQRQWIR